MSELTRDPPERLNLAMRGQAGPDPVLLLGAGASVKSGIPLAGDLVSMAAIWGYCQQYGRVFGDPTLTRSDWWRWLSAQGWFDPEAPLPAQYPRAVERLLQPRESRREFFLHVLDRAQVPSVGYEALARLVAANTVRHVLTVNFDDLAVRASKADAGVLHVEVIEAPSDLVKFSLAPTYPQIVHLHGAVARYEDRNLEEETQELDSEMREAVLPLLRDHPLVVIGYRGAEPSIMRDLLLRGADQVHAYRHGVFWCMLPGEPVGNQLLELAERVGTNFRIVEIPGFDEALVGWAEGTRPAPAPRVAGQESEPDVPDLRPERGLGLCDLDRPALASRLAAYAERMGLDRLTAVKDDVLWVRLEELRLARLDGGEPVLTRAAALLFGSGDRTRVEIRCEDVFLPVAGNLFGVLDRVLEALDELNQPFRLKGATSEDVRRFDPRAIKEVVVNALAHRDHDRAEPVRVEMSQRQLTVTSPGGPLPGLRVELLGERGLRAYRNPVLADLFYGCGAMDKRGSGLADVRRWTRQLGGEASFTPADDGTGFRVLISARDLEPDPVTGTADPGEIEHFISNVLPIVIEGHIYATPSLVDSRREIYDAHPGEEVPPFAFGPFGLLTLIPTANGDSVFANHVEGAQREQDPAELAETPDGERLLVGLLNSVLLSWARRNELCRDPRGRRLWFPRSDEGAREVTYRARVREATRTVTKPNVSRATGRIRYWEHDAARWAFRRFGDSWGLQLVPTIVFTTDGYDDLLKGPRVGPLATRRMARDFNPQVQNDLFFWRWVFIRGESTARLDAAIGLQASFIAGDVVDAPPATGGLGADEDDEVYADDIGDDVAELASSQIADANAADDEERDPP